MLSITPTILAQIADKARSDAAQHPRWIAAIGRALIELDSNPWIDRNPDGHGLLISSPSGKVYTANGVCQCKAFEHGQACWHRAAARLVRLHDEACLRQSADLVEKPGTPIGVESYGEVPVLPPSRPLGERLAAARRAAAELNELFA
jgi:hypothetical protein